jgi:hypothetical protein
MTVSNVQAEVAVLKEKSKRFDEDIRRLEDRFEIKLEKLESEIIELKEDKNRLERMAARWKGGAAVLIALGSLMGTLLSQFENIKAFFKIGA